MTKTPCEACGGSGQMSFFQDVGRSLLTFEDCPICGGLGFIPEQDIKKQQLEKTEEEASVLTIKQKKPTG